MSHRETIMHADARYRVGAEQTFGQCISQPALPSAIRSLDDEELRTLLMAVLYEWRQRTSVSESEPYIK